MKNGDAPMDECHSFAILANPNRVSMEIVARMLFLSDIRTTKIYAKGEEKTISERMSGLASKFGSQKFKQPYTLIASTNTEASVGAIG